MFSEVHPPNYGPDYKIGVVFAELMSNSALFMDLWMRKRLPIPVVMQMSPPLGNALLQQFAVTNRAYLLAVNTAYTYMELLRRQYLISGAPLNCYDRQKLIAYLMNMDRIVIAIRDVMCLIRNSPGIGLPPNVPFNQPIEVAFSGFRMGNIASPQPQPFVPFPMYQNNQIVAPNDVQPALNSAGASFAPNYNMNQWDGMFSQPYQPGANATFANPQAQQQGGALPPPGLDGGQGQGGQPNYTEAQGGQQQQDPTAGFQQQPGAGGLQGEFGNGEAVPLQKLLRQ